MIRSRTFVNTTIYSRFAFGDNSTALLQVGIILDPLSEVGHSVMKCCDLPVVTIACARLFESLQRTQ